MKKMKKFLAFVMAMAMILGMSVTSFADTTAVRSEADTTMVTITGLEKVSENSDTYPTVTLYRIAKGEYTTDFTGYRWADNVVKTENTTDKRTEVNIAETARRLFIPDNATEEEKKLKVTEIIENVEGDNGETVESNGVTNAKVENGTFTATVKAGAYIAIITDGGATIYNPILLTATYNDQNVLSSDLVAVSSKYLYGSTAVAKSSKPAVEKKADGTNEDADGKISASVGDVITYTINPTMPNYPVGAANKTVYIKDLMDEGLTFDFSSLKIQVGNYDKDTNPPISAVIDNNQVATFTYKKTVNENGTQVERTFDIAKAIKISAPDSGKTKTGFRLVFDYEKLVEAGIILDVAVTGTSSLGLQVSYEAVLNDKATVGSTPNGNDVELKYSNNPNQGSDYTNPGDPEPTNNIGTATDTETDDHVIYTYQLAFKKTDSEKKEGKDVFLPGAQFGIYKEKNNDGTVKEDTLVDIVETNAAGYAISSKVAAGTYYVKEIKAPSGYSLSDTVTPMTVSYATAVRTTTSTTKEYETAKSDETRPQAGWLKGTGENTVFYGMSEFQYKIEDGVPTSTVVDKNGVTVTDVVPAYIKSTTVQTTAVEETGSGTDGAGTVLWATAILNTKLSSLPSTGGIGTTIFTIGGCAIMIVAAGLFFASRRKSSK